MRRLFLLISLLLLPSVAFGEEEIIKQIKSPLIANLPKPPADRPEIASIKMLVTTSNEEAQRHVRIGLNHLLGFWDLEAYRHFVIAAEADPDCPMAYWGICVSLATPGPTFQAERIASFKRLKALIEADVGTELERQLAGALAALYSQGPKVSGSLLTLTAETHRAAVLPGILACMLLRDGYDEFGEALEGQQTALKFMDEQAERHADVPAVRFYQAALLEQSSEMTKGLRLAEEVLELAPDYPPYNYLVGYYRLRNGDYKGSAQALQNAVDHYRNYIEEQKIPMTLMPEYHRALNLLAIARDLSGAPEAALELAQEWTKVDLKDSEITHPGASNILWQNRTLAARLHLSHEDFKSAIASLPGPRERFKLEGKTSAEAMWHHLRQYAEGRQAVLDGDLPLARRFLPVISKFSEKLAKGQADAMKRGAFNEWLRFSQLFLQLEDQLRAAISEAEGGDSLDSARIWLKAATDKVGIFELLNPPLLSRPPQVDWVDLELLRNDPEAAKEALESGFESWPNHPELLRRKDSATENVAPQ